MKIKSLIFFILIFTIITSIVFMVFHVQNKETLTIKYITAKVEMGEISLSVNATGTIKATRTVEVGSQVSGIIKSLFVDFNSMVKEGQVIALIDPGCFCSIPFRK